MNAYEQKVEAKKERLKNKAEVIRGKANQLHDDGMTALKAIPFGQPVMPDHHSYRSDISYRRRATGKIEKAHEHFNHADEIERRADSIGTGGISSDDPDALDKLKEKLSGLERLQETMKSMNAQARKNKEERPCKTWQLSNNSANIRTVKKRIEELDAKKNIVARSHKAEGFEMKEVVEDNRIHFIFEGKPEEEVRKILKHYGFKWSPSRGAWVRQLNINGRRAAERVIESL